MSPTKAGLSSPVLGKCLISQVWGKVLALAAQLIRRPVCCIKMAVCASHRAVVLQDYLFYLGKCFYFWPYCFYCKALIDGF